MTYPSTVSDELGRRILALIPERPELLTLDNPFGLFRVPGFECDDLAPTLAQACEALSWAQREHAKRAQQKPYPLKAATFEISAIERALLARRPPGIRISIDLGDYQGESNDLFSSTWPELKAAGYWLVAVVFAGQARVVGLFARDRLIPSDTKFEEP